MHAHTHCWRAVPTLIKEAAVHLPTSAVSTGHTLAGAWLCFFLPKTQGLKTFLAWALRHACML